MGLELYDTLTRSKREFVPVNSDRVGVYVCGVTVQGEPHVGHARAAISGDLVHRTLRQRGYQVEYLTNFTDVDDKIIDRGREEGVDYREVAERNIAKFHEMEEALGMLSATRYPKVTEHIPQIVAYVERLVEAGNAYATPDGDVYFDVRSYGDYGALSGRRLDSARSGTRVNAEGNKRDVADFALWKKARPGEPAWESPWGGGRPGWHIECTVMAMEYLGETLDVHGGGLDLVFPHHENEKAQAEALTGKPFANHWAENGLVTIGGEKMSKSTGTFLTVSDLLERFAGPVVRLYLLQTHYRSPIDFDPSNVATAESAYQRILNFVRAVHRSAEAEASDQDPAGSEALEEALATADQRFHRALDDDLNSPRALAVGFDLIRRGNAVLAETPGPETAARLRRASTIVQEHLAILGITLEAREETGGGHEDDLLQLLVDVRARAREERAWALADMIRDRLADLGVVLEDRPDGTSSSRSHGKA